VDTLPIQPRCAQAERVQVIRRLSRRLRRDEQGFTLVEVLVVSIIIGLLAAIGYAVFLGQRTKAKDAEAKNNVAAASGDIEGCRVDKGDFMACSSPAELAEPGLPLDTAAASDVPCDPLPAAGPDPVPPPDPGKIAIVGVGEKCYVVEGQTTDGHFFWAWRPPDESIKRGCRPPGPGGCHDDPHSGDVNVGSWQRED
jgi:prepilin-type N-terminal cleavage/methylation domain-containing protein